jgi:hypothetical protein
MSFPGGRSRKVIERRGRADPVSEQRYISLAERARRLIDKGVAAWQRLQTFGMTHDELVDSLVLRAQELWLPHHETDAREFRVTLVVSLHIPESASPDAAAAIASHLQALEQELSDREGSLVVRAEMR